MGTVREIMTANNAFAVTTESIATAADRMREHDIGSLPIIDSANQLTGMLTGRDIAVRCVGSGHNPRTCQTGVHAHTLPITMHVEDPVEAALAKMNQHQVKRLPVVSDHFLVGIVSHADIVPAVSAAQAGDVLDAITRPATDQERPAGPSGV